MKNLLVVCVALCSMSVYGQAFKDFGVPTASELQLKQSSLDPDADAIILAREAISNYNDDYNLVTNHHVRIKILKEKGLEYADVSIPFYRKNDFEYISNVEAVVINTTESGSIDRQYVDRKSIYTQKIDDTKGTVTFSFPSVKVGSIIEYQYVSVMKSYGGLDDWKFQDRIPVLKSRFALTIIPTLQFSYLVYKSSQLKIDIKNDEKTGRVDFEMQGIPPLTDEPYMDSRRDYLQRVVFQLSGIQVHGSRQKHMTSWKEVIRELSADSDYGGQLKKNLAGTDEVIKLAKLNPFEHERMKTIYDFVRKSMNWNHYYGVYTAPIKDAWAQKSGSSTAINLILVNLLESAGLEVYPMLVADRGYGKVNADYPFIDQFSKTIAVVMIGNRKYYLDATEKFLPVNIIPSSILNTTGLIVNRKAGGIVTISDENYAFKESIVVKVNFDKEKNLHGETVINSLDYAKSERRELYHANPEKYVDRYFASDIAGIKVDKFELKNDGEDSLPLLQKFTFSTPVNETGEYAYLGLNYFTGFTSNPFLAKERFSSINFGYKRTILANVLLEIPEGYKIDALPKSTQLVTADKDIVFRREIFPDEKSGKILAKISIDCKSSYYDVERYPEIKQFYKQMFDLLNEQVVLKKI